MIDEETLWITAKYTKREGLSSPSIEKKTREPSKKYPKAPPVMASATDDLMQTLERRQYWLLNRYDRRKTS